MKKFLFYAIMALTMISTCVTFSSCSKDDDEVSSIDSQLSSLYSKTDYYVKSSTGAGSSKTSDGKYIVTKIGKLVVVKKNTSSNSITYSELASALKNRYRNTYNVNDVFVNNGGTVTIDCR